VGLFKKQARHYPAIVHMFSARQSGLFARESLVVFKALAWHQGRLFSPYFRQGQSASIRYQTNRNRTAFK